MPIRKTPLITGNYYHIFNRSTAKIPIFISKIDYLRAKELLLYYSFQKPPLSYSSFKRLNQLVRKNILEQLKQNHIKIVDITCFCFMPNHFHLLLKQKIDNGIKNYLKNFQNSYAKYFNIKNQRQGPLFQNRFKAVLIEDNDQLLHVSRYIHLNPYSSFITRDIKELLLYPWSSLSEYLEGTKKYCNPNEIIGQFKKIVDYKKFVVNQADYQRSLEEIKHLTNE